MVPLLPTTTTTKDNDDQDYYDDEFTLSTEERHFFAAVSPMSSSVVVKWIPMPKPSMPLSMSWNVTTSCADGYYSLIRKKYKQRFQKDLPIQYFHVSLDLLNFWKGIVAWREVKNVKMSCVAINNFKNVSITFFTYQTLFYLLWTDRKKEVWLGPKNDLEVVLVCLPFE